MENFLCTQATWTSDTLLRCSNLQPSDGDGQTSSRSTCGQILAGGQSLEQEEQPGDVLSWGSDLLDLWPQLGLRARI